MLLPWTVQEVLLSDTQPRKAEVQLNMDTPNYNYRSQVLGRHFVA